VTEVSSETIAPCILLFWGISLPIVEVKKTDDVPLLPLYAFLWRAKEQRYLNLYIYNTDRKIGTFHCGLFLQDFDPSCNIWC
jgi:hypothetical protein